MKLCLQLQDVRPFWSSAVTSTITAGNAQQCSWEVLVHWNSPSVFWHELTELRRTSQEAESNFTSCVCNFCGKMLMCEVVLLLIKFNLQSIRPLLCILSIRFCYFLICIWSAVINMWSLISPWKVNALYIGEMFLYRNVKDLKYARETIDFSNETLSCVCCC